MATKTQGRADARADATKRAGEAAFDKLLAEIVEVRVNQEWIARILGGVTVALVVILCALAVIALQL